jgi:hypothetical protein
MSNKLKVLGLALIVVGAFGAASASAQAAQFTVEKVAAGAKEPIAEAATPTGTLTLTVPGQLRITCTTLKLKNGSITVGTDEGTVESLDFGTCTVDNNAGEAVPHCTVKDGLAGAVSGTIRTNPISATLVKIAEEGYVTFKPESGTTFVTLVIEGCPLEASFPVTGTLNTTIEAPKPGVLATSASLVANAEVQKAGGDAVLFKAKEAILDATVGLHLVSDRNWGFDL